MGRKKRNQKHGESNAPQSKVNLPKATGKYYWSDGFWTDPRLNKDCTTEEIAAIREDWRDLEWAKTTDWYKEKKAKEELEKH